MKSDFFLHLSYAFGELAVQGDRDFLWIDFGSAGTLDLYLLPLFQFQGRCIRIDGRSESSTALDILLGDSPIGFQTHVIDLDCWVSSKTEYRRVFFKDSGTSFYPDLDFDFSVLQGKKNSLQSSIVQTVDIAEVLDSISFEYLSFCKVDLEGTEREILQRVFECRSERSHPVAIEVEVNIGTNSDQASFADFLRFMDDYNYRLIDMRKTTAEIGGDYYDSIQQEYSQLSEATHKGILHQFDGFFINRRHLLSTNLSRGEVVEVIAILCCYRQFALALRLIERSQYLVSSVKLELLTVVQKIMKIVDSEARIQPFSVLGLHPFFNYNKYR